MCVCVYRGFTIAGVGEDVASCWVRSAARQAMVTAVIVNTIVYEPGAIFGSFVEGVSATTSSAGAPSIGSQNTIHFDV